MGETAKWYVVHTYSGYEAMVKDTLEKVIENNNLQEQILEIKIPMEETIEEKANELIQLALEHGGNDNVAVVLWEK